MNRQGVRTIKVKTKQENPRELTYEVVYLQRVNDLRDECDRRTVGKALLGDGWRKDRTDREVLNDHVDEFIDTLDRNGFEYKLLFEKDLEALEA